MFVPETIICESEKETAALAKKFSTVFKPGDVIALNGDLGTGKTFFVKQICKTLKINNTSSPSFAIVNEYNGEYKVFHFDFYRLKKVEELFDIGFDEYLLDPDAITFIEWAGLFPEVLPARHFEIKIDIFDKTKRKFKISKHE